MNACVVIMICNPRKFVPSFLLVLLFPVLSFSQETTDTFLGEDIDWESVLADIPTEIHPRQSDADILATLPFLTRAAARRFVAWRDSVGLDGIENELAAFTGLDDRQKIVISSLLSQSDHTLFPLPAMRYSARIGTRSDFDSRSVDTPYYARISAQSETIGSTCLTDRDTGEPRAFDLLSGSVEWRDPGNGFTVIAGDYRPGYGQGLVWSKYGRAYISGTAAELHEPSDFTNRTFEETRFLRGGYAGYNSGTVNVAVWGSRRRLDATLDEYGEAVTIRETGIHTDDDNRENLNEHIVAARVAVTPGRHCSIGVMTAYTSYSPGIGRIDDERHLLYPAGKTFRSISTDGRFGGGDTSVFWEHARNGSSDHASIFGLRLSRGIVTVAGVGRYYSERYWARYSGALSSFGTTGNEKGAYAAIDVRPRKSIRFRLSMDLARTLGRTYTEPMPESRNRYQFVTEFRPAKTIATVCSFRRTEDSLEGDDRWSGRIRFVKRFRGVFMLKEASMAAVAAGSAECNGSLFESGFRLLWKRVRINGTVWMFAIPDYSARYYAYVRNVPGRGRMEALWGDGGGAVFSTGVDWLTIRYKYISSDMMGNNSELGIQIDKVI